MDGWSSIGPVLKVARFKDLDLARLDPAVAYGRQGPALDHFEQQEPNITNFGLAYARSLLLLIPGIALL